MPCPSTKIVHKFVNDNVEDVTIAHLNKLRALDEILEKISSIEGNIAEFGSYRGSTAVSLLILGHNSGRSFSFWDTFEGLPETTLDIDKKFSGKRYKTGALCCSLEDFVKNLNKAKVYFTDIDIPEYSVIKGDVRETFNPSVLGKLALALVDVDYYEGTKFLLENLEDLMVKGGYIYLDDHRSWKGAKAATEEFLANTDKWKHIEIGKCDFLKKVK